MAVTARSGSRSPTCTPTEPLTLQLKAGTATAAHGETLTAPRFDSVNVSPQVGGAQAHHGAPGRRLRLPGARPRAGFAHRCFARLRRTQSHARLIEDQQARRLFVGLTAVAAAAAATSSFAQLSDDAVRARVDALMARMTLEEKAGQITQHFVFQEVPKEEERAARKWPLGVAAACCFKTAADINRFQQMALKTRLGIPLLVGFDVIHGFHTVMPRALAMAASWDPAVAQSPSRKRVRRGPWASTGPLHPMDIGRDARWGRTVEGAGGGPDPGIRHGRGPGPGASGPYIGARAA